MNEHRLALIVKNTVLDVQRQIENNVIWDLRNLEDEEKPAPTQKQLLRTRGYAKDAVEGLEAITELMNVLTNLEHVKTERRKADRKADNLESDLKDAQVEIENLQKHIEKLTTSNIALDA